MSRAWRGARWLLATSAVIAIGSTLVSCTDDAGTPHRGNDGSASPSGSANPGPTHGPAPVRAPDERDRIDLRTEAQPTPFQHPKRPNLLMITLDDASKTDMAHMPHLQRLIADQGVTLDQGIAPTPICVPARASLLTGQYANNHGALTINGEGGGFEAFENDGSTLPVWLQDAGYRTMFIGKYLNRYGMKGSQNYVPPGWSDWKGTADPSTYNFVKPTYVENGKRIERKRYVTDVNTDLSVSAIEDGKRSGKPWYLWVNQVAPHHGGPNAADDPARKYPNDQMALKTTTPAPQDENTFRHLQLPDKPSMFEDDVSDKVVTDRPVHRIDWTPAKKAQAREAHQQRVESLQSVDRSIRDTVAALQRTGQLESTYIVVTSDNGFSVGEHRAYGKLWPFRENVDIPMIIRGPGLPHGVHRSTPASNADWAPTFAALAGVQPGRDVDGVNLVPYLNGPSTTRVIPLEGYPVFGGREPFYSGVRVGPWTYVVGRNGGEEMYYRTVDPYENNNLAKDPRYEDQLETLRELAEDSADCAGSACPKTFYR